jgi:ATP-dependent DNA helicase RecG
MSITNAEVEDQSGSIRVVWFNQPYIANMLPVGTLVSLSGKVALDKKGIYLSSPSYEKSSGNLKHTGRLIPIYPETEGISSKYIRSLLKPILDYLKNILDPLPADIVDKYKFPDVLKSLRDIHFPDNPKDTEFARNRFAFEELLMFQLRALITRKKMHSLSAPQIYFNKDLVSSFVNSLPFKLTDDQRISAYEIIRDMERNFPMNRLLNGDVGAGKTVVALIAALCAIDSKYQAVIMAPTEILARQHFNTIRSLIKKKDIKIGLLTGAEARQWPIDDLTEEKISKKLMQEKISKGEIELLIGTHAVIQKQVSLNKLGFLIIDEQHRFGIKQRMKLVKNKKLVPHLLSMTATPIPRTLALTIYGDLDVSLIKQKPKGRKKIITRVVPHGKRDEAYKFIDDEIKKGRQVFVICPRIELAGANKTASAGENLSQAKLIWAEVKAVKDEFEKLSVKIFPHRRIAMLHGKMKPKEKEDIMNSFRNGKYDILVSTSVVEVGVDVPNATIMMIESSERFGLAQLHQFRGRVGRSDQQSYCILFTTGDSNAKGSRLRAMEKTDDGFKLAEEDLKIRGPGEFAGVKQSGVPDLTMASLTDIELIKKTRFEAKAILDSDPNLKKNPLLALAVGRMNEIVHFE